MHSASRLILLEQHDLVGADADLHLRALGQRQALGEGRGKFLTDPCSPPARPLQGAFRTNCLRLRMSHNSQELTWMLLLASSDIGVGGHRPAVGMRAEK
jgi:hypothetical protein